MDTREMIEGLERLAAYYGNDFEGNETKEHAILTAAAAALELIEVTARLQRAETAMRKAQGQGTLNAAWGDLETYFEREEQE